jgi:uncharacterized membrane protein
VNLRVLSARRIAFVNAHVFPFASGQLLFSFALRFWFVFVVGCFVGGNTHTKNHSRKGVG